MTNRSQVREMWSPNLDWVEQHEPSMGLFISPDEIFRELVGFFFRVGR